MIKNKITLLGLITLAFLSASCGSKEKTDDAKAAKNETPRVQVVDVSARDIPQTEDYTATVEPDVKNNISSNSPLRIEKIYVDVGAHVTRGQTLVQMDAGDLRQLALQIKNQRVDFRRIDELYKVGGVSKAEWDNAKTQLDINQTAYRTRLVNTQLKSPITGVVTARNYDDGDMTGANPILVIERITPVKTIVNVSETYFPKVRVGMPVTVKLDTYGDEPFAGRVSIIHPTIDTNTHTFPVEITLPNGNQRVRPGMFARVTIAYGHARHLVIPDEAVVKQMGAGDHYVYVYDNGKVYYKKVQLGRRLNAEYEVLSGLPDACKVVIAGQNKLSDGAKVNVVE
jgi:RND family efflux transporter MFP subunit